VTENGGIIAPPVPAFYTRPTQLSDVVDQTVGRVLDLFDLEVHDFPRWGEPALPARPSQAFETAELHELEESVI